jgi:uncharacterized membrane protein HdeD (DUF308 family)
MTGLPPEIKDALAKSWKLLLTAGIVSAVLGAIAIIVPPLAAISRGTTGHRIWSFIVAIIYVIAGVWLIVNPVSGTITLTWVLAIFFLMLGLFRILAGVAGRGTMPNSGWTIVNGFLAVIIAVMVLADLPSSAAWAIGLLVGIQLLFDGIMMISAGMAAKKLFESGTA